MASEYPPLTQIVIASCNLKLASPTHFKTFCDTLKAYELSLIEEVLAADAPDVFRAQGKVKTIKQLIKHIEQCNELRETYGRRT